MMLNLSRSRAIRAVACPSRLSFSVSSKSSVPPTLPPPTASFKLPSQTSALTPPTSKVPSVVTDSSRGGSLPKLLLLGLLSTPAAAAIYLKLNPEWNPAVLKDDARWIKLREAVLGEAATEVVVAPSNRSPEYFSAVINTAMQDMGNGGELKESKKELKKEETKKDAKMKIKEEEEKKKDAKIKDKEEKKKTKKKKDKMKEKEKDASMKDKEDEKKKEKKMKKAEKKAEKDRKKTHESKSEKTTDKVEKKLEKAAKKAEKAELKVAKLKKQTKKTEHSLHNEEDIVTLDVRKLAAAATGATSAIAKTVDAATAKAREVITELADDVSPANLSHEVNKKIQATTNELLSSLKEESDAAAAEMDEQYLSNLNELDANALAIRVAQLATEMKHRSKWEAVRLLESLRRMEEDVQKKSAHVLRRQDELHKELLARELRLQQEVLSRQSRDEMDALKKQYADDLARNVSQQRASLLSEVQRTFARESKAIEDRYDERLKEVTEKMQKVLTEERAKRVQELQQYRAELRALGMVLDSSSTYEAFSHRVHKTSMAALALSDRVEAAAPLQSEVRALRKAAKSDPFIETAVNSLSQEAIEIGAPSVGQLQERFKAVKSVGHRTALIPENSGIVGQAFGTALSLLMIPPGGPIEGNDVDAVFSRADFAVQAGNLEKAVDEMKALSGIPAQISQDWITAAESRLAVEQTAKVIKAHVALLAASCS
ncbi:hypothetical protein CCR75_004632 [Bremia lactucae]|uniref:MICOS complex subunit MIC60 n=1 Tax=Bremia lactucae TaxID=4779 RepID=A0A976FR53_BRELC|nr:hypothetical protein CCR75_004632 [Bremia lactucae]